jgi:1,4-dihydroxy-2-naphthoyl-CoA synthase
VAVVVFTGTGEKDLVAGADTAQALLDTTDDEAEGADAFLAKRQPVFQGR